MTGCNYRMITFKGDPDQIAERFNGWAYRVGDIEIINIRYINYYGIVVFYKKLTPTKCNKESSTPKEMYTKYMREKDPLTIFDPLIDRLDEEESV